MAEPIPMTSDGVKTYICQVNGGCDYCFSMGQGNRFCYFIHLIAHMFQEGNWSNVLT